MSFLLPKPVITPKQRRLALAIAGVADLIQIAFLPIFFTGGYFADDFVDMIVAAILTAVLGFKWRFALAFALELVPGLDLFPTWTLMVLSLPEQGVGSVTVETVTQAPPLVTQPPAHNPDIIDAEVPAPQENVTMSRLFSGTPFDRPPICPQCGQPHPECRCLNLPPKHKPKGYPLTPANADPPADQIARIRTEKRKGSRLITLITGLEHPANDLSALLAFLKTRLGTGGSIQARTLELQGDQTAHLPALLREYGIPHRVLG